MILSLGSSGRETKKVGFHLPETKYSSDSELIEACIFFCMCKQLGLKVTFSIGHTPYLNDIILHIEASGKEEQIEKLNELFKNTDFNIFKENLLAVLRFF